MSSGRLSIDLDALARNWRALDAMSGASVQTGAVVKADAYGLGLAPVARRLAREGVRRFHVVIAEEGAALRRILGPGPEISIFCGHMAGDTEAIVAANLVPYLNSPEQIARHLAHCPGQAFGVQLDTGMNRLGVQPRDWAGLASQVLAAGPVALVSHLACGDAPENPMNARQRAAFLAMTESATVPRSLAATGGILMGPDYHFDFTRPGIGLLGGWPYAGEPVVRLSLPVVQIMDVAAGESIGYARAFVATKPTRVATLAGGYADGLMRSLSGKLQVFAGDRPCPVLGRISMDLLAVDVTGLDDIPQAFDILGPHQDADALATLGGTIAHEVFTSLGARYKRDYIGAAP